MSHPTNTLKPLLLSLLGATLALSLGAAFWYRTALAEMVINAWQGYKLTDGLVGYWSFDAGDVDWTQNKAFDRSGQGRHGEMVNMATATAPVIGKNGQALNFASSSSQSVSMGNVASLGGTANVTISAWVNPTSFSSYRFIAGKDDEYKIDVDANGKVWFLTSNFWDRNFSSNAALSSNTWNHVVVTYNGVTKRVYINGVLDNSLSSTGNLSTSVEPLKIGARPSSDYFDGKIDEVRLYARALSAEEVKRLYLMGGSLKINTSRSYELSDGLVAYWTFDGPDMDLSSSTREVFDRSELGNHGDWKDHATTTAIGKIGQAIDFDGTDDYVDIGSPESLNDDVYVTWTGWVKTTSAATSTIYERGEDGTRKGYVVFMDQDGFLRLNYRRRGANYYELTGTKKINDGDWHFVVARMSAADNSLRIYVDNEQVAVNLPPSIGGGSGPLEGGQIGINLGTVAGASADAAGSFSGMIDNVRIYNRALPDEEMTRLYLMGGSLKINTSRSYELSDGLVGHWSFDGSDVSWEQNKAFDRSGQANHGTITSMATATAPVMGKIGQGLIFDGSDDFIDLGTPSSLNLSGVNRFTLSAWVYPTSAPNGAAIISEMYSPTNNTVQYTFGFSNSVGPVSTTQPTVGFYDGTWRAAVEARDIDLNVWSHIVGTWDGTTLRLYRNGVEVAQSTPGVALPSANFDKVVIGKRHDTAGTTNFFPGKIDDVRIHNRALSAEEIRRLYLMGK